MKAILVILGEGFILGILMDKKYWRVRAIIYLLNFFDILNFNNSLY
jgi:hypothetical protein